MQITIPPASSPLLPPFARPTRSRSDGVEQDAIVPARHAKSLEGG